MEVQILLILTGIQSPEEVLGLHGDDAAQNDQRHQIRRSHQSVEDVRDGPYLAQGQERSDQNCQDVDPAIYLDRSLVAVDQNSGKTFSYTDMSTSVVRLLSIGRLLRAIL